MGIVFGDVWGNYPQWLQMFMANDYQIDPKVGVSLQLSWKNSTSERFIPSYDQTHPLYGPKNVVGFY
jgi:hypothetical protein